MLCLSVNIRGPNAEEKYGRRDKCIDFALISFLFREIALSVLASVTNDVKIQRAEGRTQADLHAWHLILSDSGY